MKIVRTKGGRVGVGLALVVVAVCAWVLLQAWRTGRHADALQTKNHKFQDDIVKICQGVNLHLCDSLGPHNDEWLVKLQCVEHVAPSYRVCVGDSAQPMLERYSALHMSPATYQLQKNNPAAFWKQDAALLDAMQAKLDAAVAVMAATPH